MDAYQPEQWHDFFLATSGAAAALAGLLFVALSLHMRFIATEQVYRDMARGSLIGLVMALVLSLLVLVHQPAGWLGFEAGVAGAAYVVVFGGYQLFSLRRTGWHMPRQTVIRSLASYVLSLVGTVVAFGLSFRGGPGLYVVAIVVVVIVLWSLWNAWVLVIGVADEEIEAASKAR